MDEIMNTLIGYLPVVIFFGCPIIAFIVSFYKLSQYRDAKLQRIIKPENYTDEDIKDMKKGVITSFVVAIVLTVILTGTTYLLNAAIAYM